MATTDADLATNAEIVHCTRCAGVNLGDAWLDEDAALRELRTFDRPAPPRFASTLCPRCQAYLGRRPASLDDRPGTRS